MCTDWEIAKNQYINKWFSTNKLLQKVAEEAFNGDVCKQEYLAEYFEGKGEAIEAEWWKNKAKSNRKSIKGVE